MKKRDVTQIWQEYQRGERYNDNLNLKETVEKNEDFYIGDQWKGVEAPDLEKPVINFIKRVINFFQSVIISEDIAVQITPGVRTAESDITCQILKSQIDRVLEFTDTKTRLREALRNCAIDGDGCCYIYWNMEAGPNGDPEIETVDNVKVLFGNPMERDVQKQPSVILVMRHNLKQFKEQLLENGFPQDKIDLIHSDYSSFYGEDKADDSEFVTELIYMWKQRNENGEKTVHFMITTQDVEIKGDTDTGYRLYPISWMAWDIRKNSYHGQSPITGLIPNQLFVNKLWAMSMEHVKKMAFPKIIFDQTRIRRWTNRVGEAIGVVGNVNEAVASTYKAADMSTQVLQLVDKTIEYTKDFMGANDAALGNLAAENTSAIIAVQKAASAPLDLQRHGFHKFVEDVCRILLEMMRVNYGVREITFTDELGSTQTVMFDFGSVEYDRMNLDVDIGGGSYFNELSQISTADKLLQNGVFQDAILYLESIPDKYVFNKHKIIAKLREQQALQQQMMGQTMGVGVSNQQYDPLKTIQNATERIGDA